MTYTASEKLWGKYYKKMRIVLKLKIRQSITIHLLILCAKYYLISVYGFLMQIT